MALLEELQRKKGLASLIPPQGGGKPIKSLPPGKGPWHSCPHPEEEILLADDSWIKAKDIKTGDKVKTLTAKDFKEGEYEITRAEIIDNQPRCEVFFKDSKSIISSYSHPYAVEDKGFVEAQDIQVGDTVGDLIVTATKPLDWGPVVSLSVDKAETYMLKAGSEDKPVAVLSHNKTPLPGKIGDWLDPLPPRPPIGGPDGPMPPRPPGISLAALKRKRQQLREQLRQIEAQIRSLGSGRPIRDPWDFGPEPPMPTPWDPQPIGPGTPPPSIGPISPPSIGPGTPIGPPTYDDPIPYEPPPMPPRPKPPWGG